MSTQSPARHTIGQTDVSVQVDDLGAHVEQLERTVGSLEQENMRSKADMLKV